MRVARILRRVVESCRSIHQARMLALVAAVESLIRGGRLTLTGIGRSYSSSTPKHSIKRADRLVGNHRLWGERLIILRALAKYAVRGIARPVVLIDWTGVGREQWALVAAVPILGRALPILFEVHPQRRYGNRRVQEQFLQRLDAVLPVRSRPIIVADAGFRRPFYRAVDKLGWGFVIRVRGAHMRLGPTRTPIRTWFAKATSVAQDLGHMVLLGRDDLQVRAVLGAKPSTFHRRKTDYQRTKAAEPWLLATNLWHHSPSQITEIYASRMKIEESFRDTKNPRYGWAFEFARSDSAQRLEVLLLVGALATFVCVMVGIVGEQLGLTRRLQANTIRDRRVLSLFQAGRYLFNDPLSIRTSVAITSAVTTLRAELDCISPSLPNGSWWDFHLASLRG